MIVYHQNQLGGYVGAHRYYAPLIWQVPQHIGVAAPVTTVAITSQDRTHLRYAVRDMTELRYGVEDLTGPRYWVRRIQ